MNLGDGADGRARIVAGGFMLDRDRGRQPFDEIDVRASPSSGGMARIRRQRLDVAALALRVQRVERERRLARAGQAGNHDQTVCAARSRLMFLRLCVRAPRMRIKPAFWRTRRAPGLQPDYSRIGIGQGECSSNLLITGLSRLPSISSMSSGNRMSPTELRASLSLASIFGLRNAGHVRDPAGVAIYAEHLKAGTT